ncbi:hypothetical protein W03_25600 [Nitrosomonas sp. PY1]|uniref:hypothetical protein n=1 Tax=Nitrosomonas sp. PY1 TaxID=1803906 RepID=UPI001FC819BF|nr:hypothetical protein [Nitrosomonas sp. PY1]GKS70556.1 hypothetical protein W03_25600 [Nitrosomonas sp. PY1]
MNKSYNFKATALSVFAGLIIGSTSAFAHTRLDVPTMVEGTRIINNLVAHACGENNLIGTSIVFPDGADSTILVDGQPHTGALTDFLTNYGNNAQLIFNRGAFDLMGEKTDSTSNVVGFWAGGGPGVDHTLNVATPFRLTAPMFEPSSCATSAVVYISIANVCQITGTSQFGEGIVDLWTHNNLGTPYDRVGTTDDGPAPWTITRDLTVNPLPASCGTNGVKVELKPSASQINRDMPIFYKGSQVWPQ